VSDVDAAEAIRTLRGIATFRSGNEEAGLRALAGKPLAKDAYVLAERAYYHAFALWMQRRLDEAEGALAPALDERADVVRARALGLLGWIETSRRRYAFAARAFSEALTVGQAARHRDQHLLGAMLQALSGFAAEMIDLPLSRLVERQYEAIEWSDELAPTRSYVLQNRALLALLAGAPERAWDLLHEALRIAPNDEYCLQAHVGLTAIHRIAGDWFAASRHLASARQMLHATKWGAATYDSRMALLEYACEAARLRDPSASEAMTRYASARKADDAMAALHADPRVAAAESTASGLVAQMRGDLQQAIRIQRRAMEQWSSLGYRTRLGQAALDLYDLTAEPEVLDRAERATAPAPKSWLRREVERRRQKLEQGAPTLTPAERRVMRAICEGKRAQQIADEFGRSLNTINNQTRRVFAALGVHSRGALIAKCAREGLIERG
jgi:DNA-binding NarL/FixJ family response regulator